MIPGQTWTSLYTDATEGFEVLADLDAAIDWTNHYIARINDA